jgi:hypothetical protein
VSEQQEDTEAGRIRSLDEQDQRIGRIEQAVDKILGALGKGEGQAQKQAEQHEERKLDAPSGIADEISRQLDERDQRDKAAKADAEHAEWRTGVDKSLADLREQPPEPPQRGIERIMWGKR